ncbi:MAG: hypothetical protein QM642_04610 [Edaphocola sp.]
MNIILWLLCLLIGLVPAWLVWRKDRLKQAPLKWLPAVLRFFTFFVTALLLLAPAWPTTHTEEEKPLLIFLQDNSSSVKNALGQNLRAYQEAVDRQKNKWQQQFDVLSFKFGNQVTADSTFDYNDKSTDMAAALHTVAELYRDRNIGAVILASDGVYNMGQNPLYSFSELNVPIYTLALGDSTKPIDMGITKVYVNKTVPLNNEFEITAEVKATRLKGVKTAVQLFHNGAQEGSVAISMPQDDFAATASFKAKANQKGFQKYSLKVPALPGEKNTANNQLDFYVEVIDEAINVLIVAAGPHPDIAAIKESLEAVPLYKVTVASGSQAVPDLGKFHLAIAYQIPSVAGQNPQFGRLPVWYILGAQSNMQELATRQNLVTVAASGTANNVLPQLNGNFVFFTLPANIREILNNLPPLQVPNGSYKPLPGTEVLFSQKIGAVQTEYPLWMFKNGEQPAALLAGEGLWRWRMYEYKNFKKHETVDELIRQTVSFLSVQRDTRPFKTYMDKYIWSDNEPVQLLAELKNVNGELVNTPDVRLQLGDSSQKNQSYTMERDGRSYRLNFGLLAPGNYTYRASTAYNGKNYTATGSFSVAAVPLEQLRSYSDYDLMAKIAGQSGGAFFTQNTLAGLMDSLRKNDTIKPVIHSNDTYEDWIDKRWLFFLIFMLAACEWLLRKYWNI